MQVSVGSISAPRKTIEVAPPVLNDGRRESGSKRRRILLTIEEVWSIGYYYDCILLLPLPLSLPLPLPLSLSLSPSLSLSLSLSLFLQMYNVLLELDDLEQRSTSNETYSKQREELCEKLFDLTRLKATQEGSPTSKKYKR